MFLYLQYINRHLALIFLFQDAETLHMFQAALEQADENITSMLIIADNLDIEWTLEHLGLNRESRTLYSARYILACVTTP